jgi:hypothetical protein
VFDLFWELSEYFEEEEVVHHSWFFYCFHQILHFDAYSIRELLVNGSYTLGNHIYEVKSSLMQARVLMGTFGRWYFGQNCKVRVQSSCYLPIVAIESDYVGLRGDDFRVEQLDEVSGDVAKEMSKGDDLLMSASPPIVLDTVDDVSDDLVDLIGVVFELDCHVLKQKNHGFGCYPLGFVALHF